MKINSLLLHNRNALVQEKSSYPRNRIPMGVSISVFAHLVKYGTHIQFMVSLNLLLMMPCCHMAAVAINGLTNNTTIISEPTYLQI